MAEVIIATSASVVGLIGGAVTVVRELRAARDWVHGAEKTLKDASDQTDALEASLRLVQEEEALQTVNVLHQVRCIKTVADEAKVFFDRLAAEQQRSSGRRFVHALKSGGKEDTELRKLFDRLDRARDELVLRISVAQVGLIGSQQDGFRVAFGVLDQTNERVNQVLGINLALMDRLRDRATQMGTTPNGQQLLDDGVGSSLSNADGPIPLDTSGTREPGLGSSATDTGETSIYDNVTLGQARIMTGDIGMDNWQRVSKRKTTIARNRFEGDVRIVTGDIGGESAARFNETFWN
ncbi:hypothetical protein VFPFJ_03272 [Purpureocillium lilacinum]|uniref:Uncharacterized protein n=1 Tax=Purpureocillium lilacinum TaxID=33203 RepID=A0A179HNU4_PURLI|nr:hypothetical protein VFPFJ_03272 [Purpureocillium lilacinum]OAQ91532.1 hypothetical protein VFPFJ_03272 [Purpureocillium lilacinum]PWI67576.1 hypothetical protein PCL_02930 [Purpureocillium lilacinum]